MSRHRNRLSGLLGSNGDVCDLPFAILQPVADAWLCRHQSPALRPQLLPQLADIDTQILHVIDMRRAP
jgi:hypothetical protein